MDLGFGGEVADPEPDMLARRVRVRMLLGRPRQA
jgi:hypothetical protein